MQLPENPYRSPSHAGHEPVAARAYWVTPVVVTIATISFWFGLFLVVMKIIIIWVPGRKYEWDIVSGVLLAFGVLIPKWRYRIAAVILGSLCFFYAYSGYVLDIEYRKWLREQDAVSQVRTLSDVDFLQSDPWGSMLMAQRCDDGKETEEGGF